MEIDLESPRTTEAMGRCGVDINMLDEPVLDYYVKQIEQENAIEKLNDRTVREMANLRFKFFVKKRQ